MTTRQTAGSAAGFTLIESMIAMFFIAFIAGEMAMVTSYSGRSTNLANRITQANMIAEGILEQCRNAAYNNLNTRFSTVDNPADPIKFDLNKDGVLENYNETCTTTGTTTTCTAAISFYTTTRTITPIPSTTAFLASTLADVTVRVSWPKVSQDYLDAGGTTQSIQLSTVRAKF